MHAEVLDFWFTEIDHSMWWNASAEFDARIKLRFEKLLAKAIAGELQPWRQTSEGRLAEIIILDQFSRNIYRNTPQAFAQDAMALALSQEAVLREAHTSLPKNKATFLLMPFMHSESQWIHKQAEPLFKQFTPKENYEFELKHKIIIDRFNRYPHRNSILGRPSTPEETASLQQPNSSF